MICDFPFDIEKQVFKQILRCIFSANRKNPQAIPVTNLYTWRICGQVWGWGEYYITVEAIVMYQMHINYDSLHLFDVPIQATFDLK